MTKRSNRPLTRSFVKLGTRLFLGSKRAHFQDHIPGLAITPAHPNRAIVYRGEQINVLQSQKLLGHGQTAVHIIGSGPSIEKCDVAKVDSGSAILLNGAVHLLGGKIEQPLAVAVEDERFVWRHFELLRKHVAANMICLLSVQVIRAICEHDPSWLSDKRIILIDNILRPYGARRRSVAELSQLEFVNMGSDGHSGISLVPDKGVFQGGSVAISAMQFLIACRPRLIGLFGIDISNADLPRFYETKGDTAYSGIALAEARILGHFATALAVCEKQDILVECYSEKSALLAAGYQYSDRFSLTRHDRRNGELQS